MTAERAARRKTLVEKKKYASIYEINMLRCICGLCEDGPRRVTLHLVMEKHLWKDN
jgi:NADH-quinone oxidoreductase subunit I